MGRKTLIFSTIVILVFFGLIFYFSPTQVKHKVNTESQVTLGSPSAKVNVIVFEEFTCAQCKRFHNETMRQLHLRYVDTGKVKLTLIPVAYLDTSIPAFSAACCISKQGDGHLKAFLDHVFSLRDDEISTQSSRQLVASYAMKQINFAFAEVAECIKSDSVEQSRERTLVLAHSIYKDDVHMPTVLVNGRLVSPVDKQSLFATIESELKGTRINGQKK